MNSIVTLLFFVSCVSTSAIPSVVLRPEVKLINTSWTVYACPSDGAADDQTTAFVLPDGNGYVRPNDVVISKQAGGMMHKISHSASLGTYGVFLGKIAELDDVFEQVKISEPSQETEEIERPESQESVPDSNLIKTLTSRNGLVSGNTTVVKLKGRSKVWKCAGHVYQGENETSHVTFYLVIPRRESDHINVDDVLVGSSSGGFLEKVTEIVSIPSPWRTKFVHTELLLCGNLEDSSDVFRINEIRRGLQYTSCVGGDGIPGLQMFQRRTPRSVSVGSVIPGRPSQEFAAKVLRSFQKDGYNFFEVSPVESIEGGEVTVASTGITTDRHARQKRTTFTAGKRFKATFPVTLGKVKVPCGTFTASAKAIFRAYPRVSITLRWSRPFLHRIKASLDSSVTLRVTLRLDFKCRVSYTGPKKAKFNHPIDNRHLVSLCIPIWAGICIPVGILADLKVKYVLEAQGKGFAELSLERTGSVDMSAGWSSTSGVFSSGPDFTLSSPAPKLSGGLTRDQTFASATLTVTPALKVHVPNLKTIARFLRAAGWWIRKVLRKLFKVENQRRIQPILEFVVSAPLVGRAKVTACPNDCDPPQDKLKVEGHAGLPESIDGDLTVKVPLTSISKTWKVFSIPGKHYDGKKCFASNIIKCNGPPKTTPTPPTEEPTTPMRPTTPRPSSKTEPSTLPTTSSPSTMESMVGHVRVKDATHRPSGVPGIHASPSVTVSTVTVTSKGSALPLDCQTCKASK
ncbi:uncharacterized protein LOC106164513 isoform X4 [Lingula anatina]|uniref:Uncharacterized protein LOC106164513 isoform X4 n=1 Tax=Lingula anatina TaxID=7574 RepID=A0A1S3IIF8_LINAN|nr:uncharacterized protein LOC106164513 isoform X4 [Lingula anatina]|eukprot:XP_013397908.1 uncharacterized protein LOC106164513 isoform X4 [Lingula anatina]